MSRVRPRRAARSSSGLEGAARGAVRSPRLHPAGRCNDPALPPASLPDRRAVRAIGRSRGTNSTERSSVCGSMATVGGGEGLTGVAVSVTCERGTRSTLSASIVAILGVHMHVGLVHLDVGVTEQFPADLQVRGLADHHRRVGCRKRCGFLLPAIPASVSSNFTRMASGPLTHASPVGAA